MPAPTTMVRMLESAGLSRGRAAVIQQLAALRLGCDRTTAASFGANDGPTSSSTRESAESKVPPCRSLPIGQGDQAARF